MGVVMVVGAGGGGGEEEGGRNPRQFHNECSKHSDIIHM